MRRSYQSSGPRRHRLYQTNTQPGFFHLWQMHCRGAPAYQDDYWALDSDFGVQLIPDDEADIASTIDRVDRVSHHQGSLAMAIQELIS